jgi:Membrane-bound metallopeptidase
MNLIGKILVGVIFVMSIVFMTFAIVAFSTQHNWKEQFQKVDAEKQLVQSQNSKLQQEIAQLKEESEATKDSLQKSVADLAKKNGELAKENADLAAQVDGYRDESNNMCVLATQTQENMAKLRDELVTTRETLAKTETAKHELFEDLVKANDTARALSLELATLKSYFEELKESHAQASELLARLGYDKLSPEVYANFIANKPPQRVEGTIVDMRQNGMLEINIGSDDGLIQGHQLHVYRDNEGIQSYLGRIEIIKVEPSKSAGKIMPEYRTGTIMANDYVTSDLNQITTASL